MKQYVRFLRRLARSEDGSFSIEAVIWFPIFAILLAVMMNLSMLFHYESQMLRVAQDATRAYSLGRFAGDPDNGETPADQAESYIREQLSYISDNISVNVSENGFIAETLVSANAAEMMPFQLFRAPFDDVQIGVSTQYIVEF